MVYDFAHFRTLRFRADLRKGGKDYVFWIEFSRASARFAFSSDCEVKYGDGVNVYAGLDGERREIWQEFTTK